MQLCMLLKKVLKVYRCESLIAFFKWGHESVKFCFGRRNALKREINTTPSFLLSAETEQSKYSTVKRIICRQPYPHYL